MYRRNYFPSSDEGRHEGQHYFKRLERGYCVNYEFISTKKGTAKNDFILAFPSIKVLFDHCFIDFWAGESCIFDDKAKKCNSL